MTKIYNALHVPQNAALFL